MSNAPKRAWGPDTKVHGLVRLILHGSLFRNGHLDVTTREDESMFHGSGLSHGKMHRLALAEGGGMPFLLSACTTPLSDTCCSGLQQPLVPVALKEGT